MPAVAYVSKNFLPPILCSSTLPKMKSSHMLKKRCSMPPCANKAVIMLQGFAASRDGVKESSEVDDGTASCTRKTAIFTASSVNQTAMIFLLLANFYNSAVRVFFMRDFTPWLYKKWEEHYYELLDYLQNRFDVYGKIINPLEKHGVPTFPIFLLLLFLIALTIANLVPGLATTGFTLTVQNAAGEPLGNIAVTVYDGGTVLSTATSANGTAFFAMLPARKFSFVAGASNRSFDLSHRSTAILVVK